MRHKIALALTAFWMQKTVLTYLLLPFSWAYQTLSTLRMKYYLLRGQATCRMPVIIVGNITLGGTGKTPLVAWLANVLAKNGYRPGIITHGFKSRLEKNQVASVRLSSQAAELGDEALVLARAYQGPVVVGRKRVLAVRFMMQTYPEVDVVICDDGLQHYQLARDIEIAVVNGHRRFGNGFCLPAGPLRESIKRLEHVDYVVTNGEALEDEWPMTISLKKQVEHVSDPSQACTLDNFIGQTVHAVAGIGVPEGFFTMLKEKGINLIEHPFADHHAYQPSDLQFEDGLPILMTQKDAVKCQHFALENAWQVLLEVQLPTTFTEQLLRRIQSGQKITRHLSVPHLQTTASLQERKE